MWRGRTPTAIESTVAISSSPSSSASADRAPCRPRSRARTAVRASGRRLRPAGVSDTPRGSRSSRAPSSSQLERLDVLRERRLRDPDPPRSPRERPFVDDRDEALELAEVHRQNLSHLVPMRGLDLSPANGETRAVRATGINHVSISASDLEESTRFYEEVFGMERIATPIFDTPVQWLRVGDLQLHLFLDESGSRSEPPSPRPDDRRLRDRLRGDPRAHRRRVGRAARRASLRAGTALLPRSRPAT